MVPSGCPGFTNFKPENWRKGYHHTWTRVNGLKSDPLCQKNTRQFPEGSTPLHEIIDDYADNQQHFIRDFVPAMEKMLANGYAPGDLQDGPDHWTDVRCTDNGVGYWACYRLSGLSSPFYIVSPYDGRALCHNQDGVLGLQSKSPGDATQMWQWTADQDMLINVDTKLPLVSKGLGQWTLGTISGSWYKPKPGEKVLLSGKKCIDRGWKKEDSRSVGVWNCWGGPPHYFTIQNVTGSSS